MTSTPLKNKTVKGIYWNFVELFLRRGLTVITTLILAWFLAPAEFGLIAVIMVFIAFSDVLADAGFSQALIRKPSVTNKELNTAFYANISIATVIYAILFFCAPLIALFYAQPELSDLLRVASIAVIFNALAVVQQAILSRTLKFKLQLQVTLPASLVSGILAICLAFSGLGVWALVAQVLSQSLFTTLLYWRLDLWRPTREFGLHEFRELFSFGGYLLLEQMAQVPFKKMYVIVIAKVYASAIAGLYFFAEKIRDLILNQLVSSVQKVTYPALSQVQADNVRLKRAYRQVISVTTFIVFPILIFLAALADNFFQLLSPEIWHGAYEYLQLMCLAGLLFPLHSINLNILKVKGRSDLIFYLGIVKKTTAILIFVFTYQHGITAIIIGQIINSILGYIPNSYYSKRLINYSVREQLTDFIPTLLLAGTVGLCTWLIQSALSWPVLVELIVLGSSAGVIYFTGAWLLNLSAFTHASRLIEMKLGRKNA